MKKILYWAGRGQDLKILESFRNVLKKEGYEIDYINIEYDTGELSPNQWNQVVNNDADWWIGISLGASLLYYSINFIKKSKPSRITLINPFSSRRILSEERGFDLNNQWDFSPKDCKIEVENLELVLSQKDTKIPMYHGIELLNNTICNNKKIIFVNGDHIIDKDEAQVELAKILIKNEILNGGNNNERYNYCNIYKQ
ncbi:MAG: hypothetical protein IJK18_09185 [Clostridia bacterium]|nr:hypothetical protein [Clostridia bacterium]